MLKKQLENGSKLLKSVLGLTAWIKALHCELSIQNGLMSSYVFYNASEKYT